MKKITLILLLSLVAAGCNNITGSNNTLDTGKAPQSVQNSTLPSGLTTAPNSQQQSTFAQPVYPDSAASPKQNYPTAPTYGSYGSTPTSNSHSTGYAPINIIGGANSYTRSGNTTYGSDGSSYTQVGNTVYSNDGTSYTRTGNSTFGSDGTSYIHSGNTTYRSDGTSCTTTGSSFFCTDGSSGITSGNSTYVNGGY